MTFTSLTRRQEIGANSYLLRLAGAQLVLDSGMHPKQTGYAATPDFSLIPDGELDAVVVTHAHQDHIGSLPVLLRRQPDARVFLTQPTRLLSDVMLHNSVNVMLRQKEDLKVPELPLFTHREVDSQMKRWHTCPLGVRFDVSGERLPIDADAPVSMEFYDAGHILGSAGVLIRSGGKRIFYTGDVNFEDQTVSRAARFPEHGVDVLIMETTRGDAPTAQGWTRAAEVERLAAALKEAFDRGGCVLIPVFALGKTQELLAMFFELRNRKLLGGVPIYIGGLSTKLTEIHDRLAHETPRRHQGLQLLDEVAPFVLSGTEAATLPIRPGRIYALSSGMMTEKTLSNLFARRILEDPKNSIFFIGYADPDSPAGKLQRAKQGETIQLDSESAPQELKCRVERFSFSGHSSRETLVEYATRLAPKKIILVHGDEPAVNWVKQAIESALPATEVVAAQPGIPVEL